MITEIEQKHLKEVFQGRYTEDVIKILEERKIVKKNGKPHSAQYIRMVFQGVRNNPDIESAIWDLASKRKKDVAHQLRLKQRILK